MKRLLLFYFLLIIISFSCKKEDLSYKNKSSSLTISAPKIHAELNKGKIYNISWETTKAEKLKIELYNDQNMVQILSAVEPNSGNFTWLVPYDLKPDSLYRVKITALDNEELTAYSHFFTIQGDSASKYIKPAAFFYNNWIKGSDSLIKWEDNIDESVRIDLFSNGAFYANIVEEAASSGSYSWSIPSNLPTSSNYQIKISSTLFSNLYGLSDIFRISQENEINLVKNGNFSSNFFWQYSNPQTPVNNRWSINLESNIGAAEVGSLQSSGSISQDLGLIPGKRYKIIYTLMRFNGYIGGAVLSPSNPNRAAVICQIGDSTGVRRYTEGTYTDTITGNSTTLSFNIIEHWASTPNSGFLCKLDNIEVYED